MIVATLASNNYRKCQADYVNNLFRACKKQISVPFDFIAFTDNASGFDKDIYALPVTDEAWGWWHKLYVLGGGALPKGKRVLYFDLDTLIINNIDDLASYEGPFAGLGCARSHRLFSSGILAWEAGTKDHVWADWLAAGKPILGNGDDEWMDKCCPHAARLQHKFKGLYQYKWSRCQPGPPPDGRIIYFSREPKPDNCPAVWVKKCWAGDETWRESTSAWVKPPDNR